MKKQLDGQPESVSETVPRVVDDTTDKMEINWLLSSELPRPQIRSPKLSSSGSSVIRVKGKTDHHSSPHKVDSARGLSWNPPLEQHLIGDEGGSRLRWRT